MKKINVFLISISSSFYDWLPYASGCLISHVIKDDFIKNNFNFVEPEYRYKCLDDPEFHKNLKNSDIIGLTNWIWNQSQNDKIAKLFKKYNKNGIVIYGGVNVPEEKELAQEYASSRPFVDLFFCGPGEETFKNFLLNYFTNGIDNVVGTFTRNSFLFVKEKYKNLIIPTPYTDGIFDNILDKSKIPLGAVLETNRGCPYGCSFCDWGGLTRSKIVKAPFQNTMDTIEKIVLNEKINKVDLADANFGIFPEDVEYINHFINTKNKRKTDINLLMGGFAKNGSTHTEEIMESIFFNFNSFYNNNSIKFSFQSHDLGTLSAINRSNIDNTKLYPMMKRFQEKGINIVSEIIIGLPGDTVDGWINTIQKNVDFNVLSQRTYALHVMVNTPLYEKTYRNKHGIKTKKVLIPDDLASKSIKEYHDTRINNIELLTNNEFKDIETFETFEFMYECSSFTSNDLEKMFDVWFWFNTLYNSNIARNEIRAEKRLVKDQFEQFINLINSNEMPFFKKLLNDYRSLVKVITTPAPITTVSRLSQVNFLNKFYLRGNELVDIVLNKEIALLELRKIYKGINFDHFKETKIQNLYLMNAEV